MYSDGLFSFVLQFYEVVEYAAGIIVDSDFERALARVALEVGGHPD